VLYSEIIFRHVTWTILIKLALCRQPVLNNIFAEFHENSANSLFFDSMSEDNRTDVASTQGLLFFLCKVRLKT